MRPGSVMVRPGDVPAVSCDQMSNELPWFTSVRGVSAPMEQTDEREMVRLCGTTESDVEDKVGLGVYVIPTVGFVVGED